MSPWDLIHDGPAGEVFEKYCQLDKRSATKELRGILVSAVKAWADKKKGGVIVRNESKTRFLGLEFFGPNKSYNGEPWIHIQHICTKEMGRARTFLTGEQIIVIDSTDKDVMDFGRYLVKHSFRTGQYDLGSGCELWEGFLAPMAP
jgi:hypothetical protein